MQAWWQSLIISLHFCNFTLFGHMTTCKIIACVWVRLYLWRNELFSECKLCDYFEHFKNVQGLNCSLYHHNWVSWRKFCVWLLCVSASRRSMAQATLTRVSASSGVHSGGRLNGSIHHRTKGNCASVGPHEQDRPIAQLLSPQCITGISQNKGKDRCEQG